MRARSVVVASGATHRTLGFANGGDFDNLEINYAATALEGDIYRNQEVVGIGEGVILPVRPQSFCLRELVMFIC